MRRGGEAYAPARGWLALGAGVVVALAASGCGASHPDVVNGKQQFVSRCGACHTLQRAGTKGVTGPNLDAAFAQARRDGMKSSTFAGMVSGQIQHPSRSPQHDPQTGKALPRMPADIVTGDDVDDVAAYVGMVAGTGGKDTGRLANIGVTQSKGTAKESAGVLRIPTNPNGQLAYQYADAQAKAGQVTVQSKNDAQIPHDIAIQGNGVSARGEVVKGGGISKVEVDLKPGTYTFFCTVPGHREGGMVGKLVVKK